MADDRKQKFVVSWPCIDSACTPVQMASHKGFRLAVLIVCGVILLTGMWIVGFYTGRYSLTRQIAASFYDDNYYLPVDSQ